MMYYLLCGELSWTGGVVESRPLGPAIRHFALLLLFKEHQTISPENNNEK